MVDNDMILRMLVDVETKEALKKADNFSGQIEKKLGKVFSRVKEKNGEFLKNLFVQDTKSGSSTTKIYKALVKDMNSLVEAIVRVDRATGKIKGYNTAILTPKQIAERFGLDLSLYNGVAQAKAIAERQKAFEDAEKLRIKELERERRFHQEIGKIIVNYEQRISKENQSLRMDQGRYEFDSALGISKTKVEQIRDTIRSLKNEISSLREEYAETSAQGGDTTEILQEATQTQKELQKAEKDLKKFSSGGNKILNRIKSYGLLRIIRSVFVGIKQGFQQGIDGLVAYDKEANKTMSSISSSMEKAFGGLTLAVMPFIEIFAPILEQVSNIIADIGNAISRASAESKGMTTYTKINLDYMKKTASEANKLVASFDKFETLNGKESPFITASVDDDKKNGLLGNTKSTLLEISGILLTIGSLKIITWLQNGGITTIKEGILKIKDGLSGVKDKINGIGKTATIVSSAFAFVTSIINLINVIQNWDSASLVTKITAITSAVLGLASVIFAVLSAIPGIGHAKVFKAISLGLTAGTILSGAVSAMAFANGGIAEKGDLFVANERGPELVYSSQNNASSIMNIQQFKQAMVEAIYESSDIFQSQGGEVVLNLDGAEIARSKRFTNEINRKNAGINLR